MVPWNQCWSLVNNFLVGSCSCYCTVFSYYYYYYYYYFPSLVLKAYYRKTEWATEKWFSQEVWNCSHAILSIVFMTGFHRVFMIFTKRCFFNGKTFPENWSSRSLWIFFSRYLRHMSMSERSLFEISWKLRSAEFLEKCVRPVFMTLFCKNTEEKIVQTWNFVHI